ncbi:hypothetical protein P8452_07830 [Trifolium repens]|nr:hypothetical protein P8452_07830 [Trifolium repens]
MKDPQSPGQKRTMPERKGKSIKRGKQIENTTTTNTTIEKTKTKPQSVHDCEQYSETRKKKLITEVISISSSHHTTTQACNDEEDSKDCDSTASTPKQPEEKKKKKQFPATETKAAKKKLCDQLGSSSAPPKLKDINEWTGMLEDHQYKKINKILFCQPEEEDDNDFLLNHDPSTQLGYECFNTGVPIPEWMPVTFRPTPRMNLNDICAYTTAYVFMRDDEQKHGFFGDRKALKSLMPRTAVDSEIINLVVARSNWLIDSLGKRKSVWYMPTQFAQYCQDEKYKVDYIRRIYQKNFMPTNSVVSKIFIPMNDQGSHWFLLVVDFNERKCYWLDSAPSEERHHPRRHSIIRMQVKLEEILFDHSYKLMNLIGHDNLITNFTIVQPSRLPQQRPGSNDCGLWVSKWMIECPFSSNYENITVVTATRLKLALYLCHSSNNVLLKPLLTKAARYWSDMERKRKALVNV